jgi:hypothetical protein
MRRSIKVLSAISLLMLGLHNASAQTVKHTPRGYPYDAKVCAGGFHACMNHYLQVGWQSAAAQSYCSQACRDYPRR